MVLNGLLLVSMKVWKAASVRARVQSGGWERAADFRDCVIELMKESTGTEIRQSLIAMMSSLDYNDYAESREIDVG